MNLEDLEVYRLALQISDLVWDIYNSLPKEHRFNIGSQILDASDSIGANIAEGNGRFHYRDSMKFYYNSRGSLSETKHWIILLNRRNLIQEETYNKISELIDKENLKLNNFINSIKARLS